MAMSTASASAEVASAIADKLFSAAMIQEHGARSQQQPDERSNEALKHYRDILEIGFQAIALEQNLDLEPDTLLIRKCTHDSGEGVHFEQGAHPVAFSWS